MSRKMWSASDANRAVRLRESGMTYGEVARTMGRSVGSVESVIRRTKEERVDEDWSMRRFRYQATRGSTRLLAEIQRVFGA